MYDYSARNSTWNSKLHRLASNGDVRLSWNGILPRIFSYMGVIRLWWCTILDGILPRIVSYMGVLRLWWCTILDGILPGIVSYMGLLRLWWCTILDGIPHGIVTWACLLCAWAMYYSGFNSTWNGYVAMYYSGGRGYCFPLFPGTPPLPFREDSGVSRSMQIHLKVVGHCSFVSAKLREWGPCGYVKEEEKPCK